MDLTSWYDEDFDDCSCRNESKMEIKIDPFAVSYLKRSILKTRWEIKFDSTESIRCTLLLLALSFAIIDGDVASLIVNSNLNSMSFTGSFHLCRYSQT